MTEYVVGFMFSYDMQSVVLIRKKRPSWQAGLLNGIGGKLESGETFSDAMAREFQEETGCITQADTWHHFLTLQGTDDGHAFEVRGFATQGPCSRCKTTTDEEIEQCNVRWEAEDCWRDSVDNLAWIIPMAQNFLRNGRPRYAIAHYDDKVTK